MPHEKQRLNYVLFLVAGSGLVTVARATTLSFLAIKLQQSFGLGQRAPLAPRGARKVQFFPMKTRCRRDPTAG